MKRIDCGNCERREIPLNEMVKVDGKLYCGECFKGSFDSEEKLTGKLIENQIDPTVCFSCEKDFGEVELNKISKHPVCNDCEQKIKQRAFPLWVKAFLVGLVLIIVIGFIWNWKYFVAYTNFKNANESFINRDYANAAILMKSVSETVKEIEDLSILSAYFSGVDFLSRDKSAEALKEFEKCKGKLPDKYSVEKLMLQANMGVAFDKKDYHGLLKETLSFWTVEPQKYIGWALLSSAHACIYAAYGNEEDKKNALLCLEQAKKMDSIGTEMSSYYNMIEHRINTKKIISRSEFERQFPNGWRK